VSSSQYVPAIPNKYLQSYKVLNAERASAIAKFRVVDITRYLPANYSKNGNIDYTTYIQKGITENQNVLLPNFPVLVNDRGLKVHTYSTLIFNKNSKLILKGSSKENYNIIDIRNVHNVKIYFANIQGDRYNHIGKGGQWGMGIGVWNSENVDIISPSIVNCWGDGLYLNGANNVNIINAVLNNNRRNGISVIAGNYINIKNMLAANTNGVLPMAGLDIEPNSNKELIKNILVDKPITYNNFRGILVSLYNMSGNLSREVGIHINEPVDDGSNRGMDLYVNKKNVNDKSIRGTILINNPQWINQKEIGMFYNKYGFDNNINIDINFSSVFTDLDLREKTIRDLKSNKKIHINVSK